MRCAEAPITVLGSGGYAGQELVRLLRVHPAVDQIQCPPTPRTTGVATLSVEPAIAQARTSQFVFLAVPTEASYALVEALTGQNGTEGPIVIDLSGAHRLDEATHLSAYEQPHPFAANLRRARYGLVPWEGPAKNGKLIANPGCYATAILMALLPLLRAGLIDESTLTIDAKSGTTGAGRKAEESLLFSEVDGECTPYRVGRHQHLPEIQRYCRTFAEARIDPIFVTHLLPVRRGITAGIYSRLKPGWTETDVEAAYDESYRGYPLVAHGPIASAPSLASLRAVERTPMTRISYAVLGNKLHVFSVIDNLMKGAASQAVENFNNCLDLPPETGLELTS